ncbi:MAG: hypothetical protein ACRCXZ_07140 [Patescibacteria group bacterium]
MEFINRDNLVIVDTNNWQVINGEFQKNMLYVANGYLNVSYKPIRICTSHLDSYHAASEHIRKNLHEAGIEYLVYIEQIIEGGYEIERNLKLIFLYNQACFKGDSLFPFIFKK